MYNPTNQSSIPVSSRTECLNCLNCCKEAKLKVGHWQLKLNVENESVFVCSEQGNTYVFNITNLFIMSNEQYIVVYWDQFPHCVYIVGNAYMMLKKFKVGAKQKYQIFISPLHQACLHLLDFQAHSHSGKIGPLEKGNV